MDPKHRAAATLAALAKLLEALVPLDGLGGAASDRRPARHRLGRREPGEVGGEDLPDVVGLF